MTSSRKHCGQRCGHGLLFYLGCKMKYAKAAFESFSVQASFFGCHRIRNRAEKRGSLESYKFPQ